MVSVICILFVSIAVGIKYEYVCDTSQMVAIASEHGCRLGTLDDRGEFHADRTVTWETFPDRPFYRILNSGKLYPTKVYEFRSGVLISGTMRVAGPFVPEIGGQIIRFSDYQYSPFAPRIWNLPGYFKPLPTTNKKSLKN